jgi:hypothetical protein
MDIQEAIKKHNQKNKVNIVSLREVVRKYPLLDWHKIGNLGKSWSCKNGNSKG